MTDTVIATRIERPWHEGAYSYRARYAWSVKLEEVVWRGGKKEKVRHDLYIIGNERELNSALKREFPHCHRAINFWDASTEYTIPIE